VLAKQSRSSLTWMRVGGRSALCTERSKTLAYSLVEGDDLEPTPSSSGEDTRLASREGLDTAVSKAKQVQITRSAVRTPAPERE
jgi:hypothetical protein